MIAYKHLKKFLETSIKLEDQTFISFQIKTFVKHTANYEETIEAEINIKDDKMCWAKGVIVIAVYDEIPQLNIKSLVIQSDNIDEINTIVSAINQKVREINKEINNEVQNS